MVYSNKFVMTVLHNGSVQKELANGTVKIPFNSSYALRFRNKNNRRALVKFFIDGEEASGGGYIIPANNYVDIERWSEKSVKFNFVSIDSEEAIDFGKNGPNEDKVKGTIEARFYLEKEFPTFTVQPTIHHHHHYQKLTPWSNPVWVGPYTNDPYRITCGSVGGGGRTTSCMPLNNAGSFPPITMDDGSVGCSSNISPIVQDGCTVEGSVSSQTFRTVSFDAETDYVSLKVFLQGYDENVESPKVDSPKERVKNKETEEDRQIREMLEENSRLQEQLKSKRMRDQKLAQLNKLQEENRKLREQLGI